MFWVVLVVWVISVDFLLLWSWLFGDVLVISADLVVSVVLVDFVDRMVLVGLGSFGCLSDFD